MRLYISQTLNNKIKSLDVFLITERILHNHAYKSLSKI